MELGINAKSEARIASSIKYALIIVSYNGNTCVMYENLVKFVIDLLDVSSELIEDQIINLKAKQEIFIEEQDKEKWIFLAVFYKCEQNIAEKIKLLNNTDNIKKIKKFNKELEVIEKEQDIILSEKQKEAIKSVNENNVCVITGGPRNRKNYNYKIYNRNL